MPTTSDLSASYRTTIMAALAHEATPAAVEAIWELRRIGWDCPAWIVRDVLLTPEQVRLDEDRYGHVAAWHGRPNPYLVTQL